VEIKGTVMQPLHSTSKITAPFGAESEKGFTLLETLVASVVLIFGLLSVASLLAYAVMTGYENKMDSIGNSLAVQKMEQLRAQSSNSLVDGGCPLDSKGNIDFTQSAVSDYSQTTVGFGNVTFEIRWNIATSNQLKTIVVAARKTSGTKGHMSNVLRPVSVRSLKQELSGL
jgi:Tfp pilus assembly protein PilV